MIESIKKRRKRNAMRKKSKDFNLNHPATLKFKVENEV